ncbi:GNAT family N-acetyltransferase [Dactylosporangium aurantiacum]|uniref:GNAT family N-acetyltransferase n=1 Tax=Dactylosporangium aurantiacum TaxID=35754 RepID=A0A9Q9MKG2_9ACTN|nr:GNAT family N-acetyltransferase [Dactylosporangium aurantiacum]MDG6104817.1 GNAT family N-acetyltransferase [Dactylosporangium aurantiacum]UWZ55631.1 GNAT family N-acetyltransferase [Dactylosporangium aurantiacum]
MSVEIHPATDEDVPAIVAMVYELAEFEKAVEECHLTPEQLRAALFNPAPSVFCHVARVDGETVGMALWFRTFSTWEGVHGVYLEDLYVRPAARGTGAGKALVAALARICVESGYPRLEWAVLDWNPARGFYESLGARHKSDWLPYRLSGDALRALAGSPAA